MLMKYIQNGTRLAKYEQLDDDGSFYGEIPECNGVFANAMTLEVCREQLEQMLEKWILFRVYETSLCQSLMESS